jgi:hypothetical protein
MEVIPPPPTEITPELKQAPVIEAIPARETQPGAESGAPPLETRPAPEPQPPESAPSQPTAVVPVPALTPKLPEELRQRAEYFTPSAYAGGGPFRAGGEWSDFRPRIYPSSYQRSLPPPAAVQTNEAKSSGPLDSLATGTTAPRSGLPHGLEPHLATILFLNREGAPHVPAEATNALLASRELAAAGARLRDAVLQHWHTGGAPLTLEAFYHLAHEIAGQTGAALLLCHNVAKAFARAGAIIRWENINRTSGQYSDGAALYTAEARHPAALLRPAGVYQPSVFYVLFLPAELGAADPGDWYRFFAHATIAACAMRGWTSRGAPAGSTHDLLVSAVAAVMESMRDVTEATSAGRAWLWSNAVWIVEHARFAALRARVAEAGSAAQRGTEFGAAKAGVAVDPSWKWLLPTDSGGAPGNAAGRDTSSHFSRRTLHSLSVAARGSTAFSLICTVEEGAACRFGPSGWNDPALAPLAQGIIDDLGWKIVEHSPRRQCVVRCFPAEERCEIDRGQGFVPLPVTGEA